MARAEKQREKVAKRLERSKADPSAQPEPELEVEEAAPVGQDPLDRLSFPDSGN